MISYRDVLIYQFIENSQYSRIYLMLRRIYPGGQTNAHKPNSAMTKLCPHFIAPLYITAIIPSNYMHLLYIFQC